MRHAVCCTLLAILVSGCGPDVTTDSSLYTSSDNYARAERRYQEAQTLNAAVPEGNYLIEVERIWLNSQDASAIGQMFAYRSNRAAAVVGRPAVNPDFRVVVGGQNFGMLLDGTLRHTHNSDRTTASLMTAPGSPAYLQVGFDTALDVLVSPVDERRINLSLTPRFAGQGPSTQMSTTLRVPLDRPILIGGHTQETESVANSLLSRSSSQGMQKGVLVLTVRGG